MQSAADEAPPGVDNCFGRLPAELEVPILLHGSDIHLGNQLLPAADPTCSQVRVHGSEQPPRGDHIGGVRGGQVNDTVAVGIQRQNQEADQVVEM
ncbi:Uncharacterised protein [Mycobacterium tuberculosis]|uniref:Uncharacterized protein n=1 Tax=Mycobacterium tuberculosis TaxID=1773 RepID=A0A655EKL9_MYCTX|nr:Uncharacterised protein [Mycobacterium tuberculosis]CFE46597.1 Uncharacterised protein [Mycobacterium tuberculosis]CFS09488.1 Uncharacterised protein [Mycobacterium tuberculosis]CKQ84065.1 Uncharacterised protein [Mycobacterium tuberculosis]CKR09902.1 Uncharacterised protein [Mycobacterium tuberculosis]